MKPNHRTIPGIRPVHDKAHALIAASSLAILLALPAGAVTVLNPSFESQTVADGDVGFLVTNWTVFQSGVGIGGGTYNPTADNFTGAGGNGTPTGGNGANVLSTNPGSDPASYWGVSQILTGTPLTAGTIYTMTVAVGDYKDLPPADFRLAIGTSSMAFPTFLSQFNGTAASLTSDALTDFSVSYTATGLETQNGEDLQIFLWGQGTAAGGTGGKFAAFDNVRVTAIPEPSAALLGCLGMLALLRRRR